MVTCIYSMICLYSFRILRLISFLKLKSICKFHIQDGAKVGVQLWVCKTQEFILVLLFSNYCTIFHMNNCKPTFVPPYSMGIQALSVIFVANTFSQAVLSLLMMFMVRSHRFDYEELDNSCVDPISLMSSCRCLNLCLDSFFFLSAKILR